MRVLVVEDEKKLGELLGRGLREEGYAADVADRGEEALWMARAVPYDAIVLDVMLPGADGFEVCRRLRRDGVWTPVLMLTARDGVDDRVVGLDAGADDYLTKPFSVAELAARLRVALRHAAKGGDTESVFQVGDLRVDLGKRLVHLRNETVHFTPTEYRLLTTLVHHAGKVLTHQFLLKEVWGPADVNEVQYLRVYMAQLRHKLETDPTQPRYILTEPGVGYRLAGE
jgi:two-component system, OmpR family, KDP operon response regulator KdpE